MSFVLWYCMLKYKPRMRVVKEIGTSLLLNCGTGQGNVYIEGSLQWSSLKVVCNHFVDEGPCPRLSWDAATAALTKWTHDNYSPWWGLVLIRFSKSRKRTVSDGFVKKIRGLGLGFGFPDGRRHPAASIASDNYSKLRSDACLEVWPTRQQGGGGGSGSGASV